jgi:DnaJ-class molecular chaperone
MEKDLYAILGIERTEDARGVHEAYRRLAKRYHPDCAGEGGTAKFREIQEAYEVLSDAQKRLSYDVRRTHQCHDSSGNKRSPAGRASPLRSHAAEPLVPTADPFSSYGHLPPKPSSPLTKGPAEVEIVIPWHAAASGVTVRLPIPMISRCPNCSAVATNDRFRPCLLCGTAGTIETELQFDMTLPRGIRDGMVVDIPGITMSHIATRPLRVRVHVELWLH